MARIGLISLGCPKNVVDAEETLGQLEKAGHEIETDPARAEVLIVNTCGFIRSAKEESIEAILDAVRYKSNGACRSVIVTGCLVQRYGAELADEIPEADAFVGLGSADEMSQIVCRTLAGERVVQPAGHAAWWTERRERVLSTPPWTAYLRVADGCDNRCTYCAIPSIRGAFRSRPEKVILDEARMLVDRGVRELNLVAQDVTRYGLDSEGRLMLPRLLEKLADLEGVRWLRLLYCYPTRITDDLIGVIADNDRVCKYVDVPLQHCSESVLRAMGRHGNRDEYLRLFQRIRERCPDIAIRTTFMVGFPGETEADFRQLTEFVASVAFDRMGVFEYSREDGTPAASLPGRVGKQVASRRYNALMALQQRISLDKNRNLIGKRLDVLIESVEKDCAIGRSQRDAPEIDGLVYVHDSCASPGDIVSVEVTEARHYDLIGRQVG